MDHLKFAHFLGSYGEVVGAIVVRGETMTNPSNAAGITETKNQSKLS